MTPDEIAIPFAGERAEAAPQEVPKSVPRAPEPISEQALEDFRRGQVGKVNGMEVLGDYKKYPDLLDIPIRFCCHCKRWDLSKDKDRAEYGDLIARSQAPSPTIEVTWEERCKEPSGLIVYLTYFEFVRVAEVTNA